MVSIIRMMFIMFAVSAISMGGAGIQSSSSLMQGGGFVFLLIGAVIMFFIARIVWRSVGCLVTCVFLAVVLYFVISSTGLLNGGIEGLVSKIGISTQNMKNPEQYPPARINTKEQAQPQPQVSQDATLYGTATVVNANLIQIQGFMFKFFGLDAPDPNQICPKKDGSTYACGVEAANVLKKLIGASPLTCVVKGKNDDGSLYGVCSVGSYDVGAAFVSVGWALAYPDDKTSVYMPYQKQAMKKTVGLWGEAEFAKPWEWRDLMKNTKKTAW